MTNDTSARSAREILAAHDQMDRAEAALDAIPAPLPAEYVTATLGSDAWHGGPEETPVADSLSDITTREVTLDGGHVTVEHFYGADGGRVEMTVHLGGVLRSSLILTAAEGEALGMALARPYGPTVGDYFDMHDRINCGRVQA